MKQFKREEAPQPEAVTTGYRPVSRLNQWPCQIKLLPTKAAFFEGANIRDNDIKSVTIVRMEVPCCGGLQRAAENALKASGKFIPWQVVTISTDGRILA